MRFRSPRRRELLIGGSTLVTGLSGCATINEIFTQNQPMEPPPLIEVRIVNRDFEPYPLSLLIQTTDGEIYSWNRYELSAATKSEGIKTSQSVTVGTDHMCLDKFLVSVSIDGEETWAQIDDQDYVAEHDDISAGEGAAPEGEIIDGELTLHPRLDNILEGQCTKGTQNAKLRT